MVVLIGFAGLVVDIGRVWIAQRQLQNAVDATSVAIAQNMPDAYEGWRQVPSYSGSAGSPNAVFGYGVTAGDPTITLICTPSAPGWKPDHNNRPGDVPGRHQRQGPAGERWASLPAFRWPALGLPTPAA